MAEKIELDRVSYTYRSRNERKKKSFTALHDFSLSVKEGEFISVIGPSGCGKSTLLDLIAGLIHPTEGEIRIDGETVKGVGTDCAIVQQGYALFPWRTVRENVEIGLEVRHIPCRERRVLSEKYIRLVSMNGYEDKYPSQLSGGMKQRVAIARALVYNPKVLLMDEPFAALDPQTREVMQNEIMQISQTEHPTIFFVTHDIQEALSISDRVVVMTDSPGTIREIVDVPFPKGHHVEDVRNLPEFAGMIVHLRNQYKINYDNVANIDAAL